MKKVLFNILSYLLTLLFLLCIFACMIKPEQLNIFRQFSWTGILGAIFLSLGAYLGNGLEYFFLCKKLNLSMEKKDILLLPLGMNLAGTLLPFQGAMAYQIFFFKKKYDFAIAHSCAITLFLYLITMILGGLTGLLLCLSGKGNLPFAAVSLILFLAPLAVIPAKKIFSRFTFRTRFLEKIRMFFLTATEDMILLFKDIRLTLLLVFIYLLRLLFMTLMFAWIAHCLKIDAGFTAILLLNFWNMLSLLFKFTPNNLGISQMVSGLLFAMIGLSMEQGILLSLAATMIFITVALTAGTAAVFWHVRRDFSF